MWESNPPEPAVPTPTGFEARGTHQSTLASDSLDILDVRRRCVHVPRNTKDMRVRKTYDTLYPDPRSLVM